MHVIAAKAICFKEAMTDEYREYQAQVVLNAKALAAEIMAQGIDVVSNGTENHLFLVDLISKDITGKEADAALGKAHITVNKNAVPNDPRSPFVTSGLRVGTPAATRRGFKEAEMVQIAQWIARVINNVNDDAVIAQVRDEVSALCARFPVYGE